VDQLTIERARRGDRDAQAALLRGLQDLWFRFCVSQLGSAEHARDATQETGLRFLRQLPTFRGESRIESWSIGIAVNVIREHRRSAVKQQNLAGEALAARTGDSLEYAEVGGVESDQIAQVRSILDDLPDRQRQAVVLRFFEGLSVDETAAAMACAPGTIKATVHQALRAIRARLDQTAGRLGKKID
jgi:RNA polymerase sigma-70 factor (ECF subfamily)